METDSTVLRTENCLSENLIVSVRATAVGTVERGVCACVILRGLDLKLSHNTRQNSVSSTLAHITVLDVCTKCSGSKAQRGNVAGVGGRHFEI